MKYACPVRREGQSPPLSLPLSQPDVSTPGTPNEKGSPCKGVRSAVVTRVEHRIVSPVLLAPLQGASSYGEIPGVKTPG